MLGGAGRAFAFFSTSNFGISRNCGTFFPSTSSRLGVWLGTLAHLFEAMLTATLWLRFIRVGEADSCARAERKGLTPFSNVSIASPGRIIGGDPIGNGRSRSFWVGLAGPQLRSRRLLASVGLRDLVRDLRCLLLDLDLLHDSRFTFTFSMSNFASSRNCGLALREYFRNCGLTKSPSLPEDWRHGARIGVALGTLPS